MATKKNKTSSNLVLSEIKKFSPKIVKKWTVFSLCEAVSGISNKGIDYDEYTFTLSKYEPIFKDKAGCIEHIKETMADYRKRGVGEKTRFLIMEIFCYEDDKIFNF